MCTVTVVKTPGNPHIRIMCNRDEQGSRPRSLPPRLQTVDAPRILMPIDPVSGGTWIGVNDSGLIACLLNARQSTQPSSMFTGRRSRGSIVPETLQAASIDEATRIASELDPGTFPPFRLLLIDQAHVTVVRSGGVAPVQIEPIELSESSEPLVFSSSGLGDDLVGPPRELLFHRIFKTASSPFIAQRKFHESRDPLPGHLAVLMSRADARTVSRTTIDLFDNEATMQVEQMSDDLQVESWGRESLMLEHSHNLVLAASK